MKQILVLLVCSGVVPKARQLGAVHGVGQIVSANIVRHIAVSQQKAAGRSRISKIRDS